MVSISVIWLVSTEFVTIMHIFLVEKMTLPNIDNSFAPVITNLEEFCLLYYDLSFPWK